MPRAGKNRHRMRGLSILHEDPDVIVIEKAAGILSCATRRGGEEYSVERALTDYVRKGQAKSRKCVYLVHRLDRETSGVMMVAKSPEVQEYFRANWNDITEKTYLACVHGHFEQKEGVFESYLAEDPRTLSVHSVKNPADGKLARTLYKVLRESGDVSLVEVQLKSGRKNQIRATGKVTGRSSSMPGGLRSCIRIPGSALFSKLRVRPLHAVLPPNDIFAEFSADS